MNESLPPMPPPTAKPFAPEKMTGGGGCQKSLLIGCGLLSLLLGIAAVVFVVNAKAVLAYAMNQLRAEVVAHLPEDVGESERQRIETGFDAALARIRSGELDPAALQDLQKRLTGAASASASRRLTAEEVTALIAALEKFNQKGPEAAPAPTEGTGEGAAAPDGETDAVPVDAERPPAP
ncbi:MAG: hypothetical protein ABIV06_04915 [Thermoanaerobaculia bacterium]